MATGNGDRVAVALTPGEWMAVRVALDRSTSDSEPQFGSAHRRVYLELEEAGCDFETQRREYVDGP